MRVDKPIKNTGLNVKYSVSLALRIETLFHKHQWIVNKHYDRESPNINGKEFYNNDR